jgi:ankyrin repeat protein
VISNNLNITNSLINRGAYLNTFDIYGLTALDYGTYFISFSSSNKRLIISFNFKAIRSKNIDLVIILLNAGGDLNVEIISFN